MTYHKTMLLNCIDRKPSIKKEFLYESKEFMKYFHDFVIFMESKKTLLSREKIVHYLTL